jgi:hypothetical protein
VIESRTKTLGTMHRETAARKSFATAKLYSEPMESFRVDGTKRNPAYRTRFPNLNLLL